MNVNHPIGVNVLFERSCQIVQLRPLHGVAQILSHSFRSDDRCDPKYLLEQLRVGAVGEDLQYSLGSQFTQC